MAVWNIYSKRQRRMRGELPDIFQYDDLSPKLRTQIVHIITETIGSLQDFKYSDEVREAYETIVDILRREYGVFKLDHKAITQTDNECDEFIQFILRCPNIEECLDGIELAVKTIDRVIRGNVYYRYGNGGGGDEVADEAIVEINQRFREDGAGYQFVDGETIRVDSQLLHAEAVKPALTLLNTTEYQGPHEEFISAYDHYKGGKNKEALIDCLKAFESTMKAICDKRGWAYDPKDTAKPLIDIMFANGLVPSFWQTQFSSLRSLLEGSIPTGRNKLAGHGQGSTPTEVPGYITAYMLHMTASTLVFLTTAEKALR